MHRTDESASRKRIEAIHAVGLEIVEHAITGAIGIIGKSIPLLLVPPISVTP